MKLPKITCPYCGKVVCVGNVEGLLKCKSNKCGKVFKVEKQNTVWVKPAGATPAEIFGFGFGSPPPKTVPCKGCGQPTTSRGYCRRCQFKKANDRAARKVEGYLRSHKNRGRLTPEEYSFAREVIEKYSAEKQPKTIHKLVVDALKEQWPERDYSFLAGFGSRSLQQ